MQYSMSLEKYNNPIPTVDGIIHNDKNQILFIKRKKQPFQNYLALPGGFVNQGECVEDALRREILEETSINVEPIEILGVYSDPKRDPRKHILSVVFVCLKLDSSSGIPKDDAQELLWIELSNIKNIILAFDHNLILSDYIKWRTSNTTFWSTKTR